MARSEVIAAAAEVGGAVLLHYDSDFDRIAAVTGQAAKWIVPRGSVSGPPRCDHPGP